jgi:hypothetical protein
MKNNRIIAIMASVSIVASIAFTTVTSYASNAAVSEGIDLVLAEGTTTETTKVIDVYYVGELADIISYGFYLNFPANLVTDAKFEIASTGFADNGRTDSYADGKVLIAGSNKDTIVVKDGSMLLGTLTLEVPLGTAAFDIALSTSGYEVYDEWYDEKTPDVSVLTIPGAKPAGPKPIDANKLGTYAEHDDAVVTVYTATVPAADVEKTFVWGFLNAEGVASDFTQTAKFEYKTVVSGEAGIVLGLKVVGDMPEGINATLTVVE